MIHIYHSESTLFSFLSKINEKTEKETGTDIG